MADETSYLGGAGPGALPSQVGGSLVDVVTALQGNGRNLNSVLALLIEALQSLFLTRSTGSFTLGAAATTVVPNTQVTATSLPILIETNAAAGTLQGSNKHLYISARNPGVSFTVATASAAAAAGTETFSYILVNPV